MKYSQLVPSAELVKFGLVCIAAGTVGGYFAGLAIKSGPALFSSDTIGAAIGAGITVIGAMTVENWKRSTEIRESTKRIRAALSAVSVSIRKIAESSKNAYDSNINAFISDAHAFDISAKKLVFAIDSATITNLDLWYATDIVKTEITNVTGFLSEMARQYKNTSTHTNYFRLSSVEIHRKAEHLRTVVDRAVGAADRA